MEKERRSRRELLLVLLCALFTGAVSFLVYTIQNGGFFALNTDFNLQQIPFTTALHNALSEGNPGGWIWNYDLGGSIIQSLSFYEMGSPFFWLTMPFSAASFPYLLPFLYILKYMTAACTAYLYLSRMVSKPRSAAVGAILYAFSGFQAVNLMFYHFHDVVAFFPLMLLGIEKVHENPKRKGFFAMAVAVNCLVNYFFFLQDVFFCIIYFLFRFGGKKKWKEMIPSAVSCLICGIWGVCMAAVLFLPSALYVTGSSRAGMILQFPVTPPRYTLYVIRGILFPGEPMSGQSSLYQMEWRSVGCYLPMIGISLLIPYLRKKRDWLRRIVILLLILSFCPLAASAFYLFSEWYYRWWYFLVLMAALASARVLDEPEEYPLRTGTRFSMIAVPVLYLILQFVPGFIEDNTLVYDAGRLAVFAGIAFAGIVLTAVLRKRGQLGTGWMMSGVCIFAALTTALTMHGYGRLEDQDAVRRDILLGQQMEEEDPQYRYAQGYNIFTLTGKAAGTSMFSSTISAGSWEFDELFDYIHGAPDIGKYVEDVLRVIREEGLDFERIREVIDTEPFSVNNMSMDKAFTPGLYELLGARYHVWRTRPEGTVLREITAEGASIYVTEEEACPIGFAIRQYISEEDLKKLDKDLRGAVMMQAAVIRPEDEDQLESIAIRTDGKGITLESIPESVRINQENAVADFSRDTRGFRCTTAYSTPTAVWFSVPYDTGWTAEIDGERADIIHSGGMMLLCVPAGNHSVTFTYETPGYRPGLWISMISLAIWILYVILTRHPGKRKECPAV